MMPEVYKKLEKIVGEDYITDSEFEKLFYSRDVSPLPPDLQEKLGTIPDIIVRPTSTQQVSDIVKVAANNKIPVIPRGGASWWLGGSVPYKGGIVLDLTSFNTMIELDENNLTVTTDCGVTWKEVMDYLERKAYFIGTRPGSAASATVGGWISTGGVGIGSYKYGSVGDLVRSLEVVLPNGQIIQTGNKELATNGSGYDLAGLFVGGEGTIGVITKATLKIIPKPDEGPYHFSYTFSTIEDCTNAIDKVVKSRIHPYHIAFGDKKHFEFLKSTPTKETPKGEIVLCITLEGDKGIIEYGKQKLDEMLLSLGGIMHCEDMSDDICADCTLEFGGREVSVYPVPGEIFVGLNRFPETMEKIYKFVDEMKYQAAVIGSMVDRRTVMIMPYYIVEKEEREHFMAFHRNLGNIAVELGGRGVGLGLYFSSNLALMHDPGSIEMMRILKKSLDPENIMNPGKIFGDPDLFSFFNEIKS
jgi:glycolate oxidase